MLYFGIAKWKEICQLSILPKMSKLTKHRASSLSNNRKSHGGFSHVIFNIVLAQGRVFHLLMHKLAEQIIFLLSLMSLLDVKPDQL